MKNKLKIIILFFVFYFLFFLQAMAAKLELVSSISEIGVGQQFQIDLMLDTEGEEINAVEGKISFPGNLLELREIRDGNSVVNFWIERPKIKQADAINFSGITPGGYKGTKGFIFSAVFEAKKEGSGAIEIRDVKVLLNDGQGTPAKTTISNFSAYVKTSADKQFPISNQIPKDTYPPELFIPEIASDQNIFDGKWFLVFATQDKGSGIDHYKVCERIKTKCAIAESPYVLQNQNLDRKVFVKAIDKNGNERIVVLPPKFPPWYQKPLVDIIAGLFGLAVLLLIIRWLMRRYKRI